ncbi:multidrug resistance-associated protein 4-like [Contarinia nasturtii]|uniref:multidrug resistance-associated protein 4-like n=1 Tax=Contarinia nasturtii TaxID=265458 RepID=UPI0012D3B549|nr:multidrug resistance-associated protein 4-like [Contarinia nasturtii]XP_031635557.1 multidrug resistance-associated protein 4-like [Contarinia nasturtii]XP_031635560.1 multidrug resistance-associated protein 4-like [Contarinia nasturtii]XP_031635561.1 multidrug resistance-associated protein 4-like [Contarinia nasturtii]XP_031635562.1 multidrug resistance-associated protein 4-like [Contarinia nasturtii]XP_031635563.1 multidrug resistance-associated protein 4-like [Contarinia nasturtii]
MNRNKERKSRDPNPVSKASILSKLTFWWLKPMLTIGMKRAIEEDDIYAVTNSMRSDTNTEAFAQLWQLELKKKKPSILRVMLKLHGFKVISLGMLFSFGETLARVIQPICLGGLVGYFAQTEEINITLNDAYWYATGIVLSTAFMTITFHPFILFIFKTACKARVACSGLIYQKTLRLSKSLTEEGQNGKIINLLSSDLAKFDIGLAFLHDTWKGPLEAIVFFLVIYIEIGISAVFGMAFLASFIPLQAWIGRRSAQLRMKNTLRTDFRVKIMNEILLGIQVIKMYAWEKSFAKMVDQIRKKEVNVIRSIAYIRATINSFTMISKVSIFLSLVSYIYYGNAITARKVFIVSSYFNILNLSMVYFWPMALTHTAEAYISIKRVQEFLLRPESKRPEKPNYKNSNILNGGIASKTNGFPVFDKSNQKNSDAIADQENGVATIAYTQQLNETPCKRVQSIDGAEKFIRFENASAVWELSETRQMNGIFEMSLEIKPGLCAIVGQVGSSKSTLLNVILGELTLDAGSMEVSGSISYASQEVWIFEGSVRDNIVFVEDFDEQRYNKVVEVCALERDFKLLPQGDATIVGEQGSSLSGGQKARVNLARAIYKKSDIYLLDDPLSAVDTHVGKHIFEKCIKGFLADKICVLVTHQLQYLKNVQHVVLLNGGKIEAQGPFQTLQRFNKKSLMHAQEEGDQNAIDTFQNRIRKHSSSSSFCNEEVEDDPNQRKENQVIGSIKFRTYKTFFKAAQSNIFVIIVFILFIVAQCAWSGADFFLSEWVNWEEKIIKNNETKVPLQRTTSNESSIKENREFLIMMYTSIMVIGTICYLCRSFSFYRMCLRISINLHDMIFRGISRAKMIFFNNNPSGRILNRFARDINNVDSLLPNIIVDVLDCFLQYVAIIVINGIVNPWLLIPAVIMTFLFYIMRLIYINAGRSFKRIEALSRSPIFSHMNATLQGLSTVRAFNASKILEKEFHEFQDYNTSCWYLFICSSRWFALWLDVVCLLFVTFVTYSFLLLSNYTESGKVGLAILSSINLIGTCQWGMRQNAELENQMTSVERIAEYAELPPEPPLESDEQNAPPKDWPYYGNIEFKSLSLRYAENSGRILRNLTFRINAKEKVGVVGRTGAGKSSIIQSLFRLAQNEGQILIDGIDIGVIGLHDLRKKISIIPQEAVLFSGSLRFNLDPFEERTDDELWNSLEQVELKSVIASLPGGIDCKVLDGGSNFSAGQRQLLCLARAILRNNRILILDEATANVDSETDRLIQETIRNKFADCTVITIAHRLHTVMDSDKILVVDAGEIMEFGHPFELIQKSDGFFKRLLDQTGSSTATALTLVAKESYDKCHAKQE